MRRRYKWLRYGVSLLSVGLLLTRVSLAFAQTPAPDAPSPESESSRTSVVIEDVDTPSSSAPEMRFTHLTVEQGLSHSAVKTILQDSHGFIWLGTEKGLNRYDGYEIEVFMHDPEDRSSLSDNNINALYEDDEGYIWIATQNGVNRLDPYTEAFEHYATTANATNATGEDVVTSITGDSNGNLWFGKRSALEGLIRYDPLTGEMTHLEYSSQFVGEYAMGAAWDILEDGDGTFWIAADRLLVELNPDTGDLIPHILDPNDRRISVIAQLTSGVLWIGGDGGLYRYETETGAYDLYNPTPEFAVNSLVDNGDGTLWVATQGDGLYLFDTATGLYRQHLYHNELILNSLASDALRSLYVDQAGVVWVGTDRGVSRFDPRQSQFSFYHHDPFNVLSLTQGAVWALCGDTEEVLIGTGEGIDRYDLQSDRISHTDLFTPDNQTATSLSGDIICNHPDYIWYAAGPILHRVDRVSGQEEMYDLQGLSMRDIAPVAVTSLLYTGGDSIWIGVQRGRFARFDIPKGQYEFIQQQQRPADISEQPSQGAQAPADGNITTLYHDGTYVWIAYYPFRFSRYDPQNSTFQPYPLDTGVATYSTDLWVSGIADTQDGYLWLATTAGLLSFDTKQETFRIYTAQDGFPSDYFTSIQSDAQGQLWLGTLRGIVRFDPDTESITHFDVSDGVGNVEFWDASWKTDDGRLFFGGDNGLTVFDPEKITTSSYNPPVVLTKIRIDNAMNTSGSFSSLDTTIWAVDELTLEHNDDLVSLEFAALGYAAPDKQQYRYMLEGFQQNWVEVDSNHRSATYTHLPAGNYIFRVQATNEHGQWSEHEVALVVTVKPAWWETWLFKGGVGLLVVALAIAGFRYRTYELSQRSKSLENQVTERTRELADRTDRLQESERRFRELAGLLPGAVVETDAAFNVSYLNKFGMDMFGLNADDMAAGVNAQTLLMPESLQHFIERVMMHKEGQYVPPSEYHVMKKDGTPMPVLLNATPILDDGQIRGFLASLTDISHQKAVEQALRASEQQLRFISDNIPAYMAYVGIDDLRYRFVNQSNDGYVLSREEIIGSHIRDIIGEENYQYALPYIEQVRQGQAVTYENAFETARGMGWLEVNYRPTFDENGEVEGIAVLSFDITERKEAQRKLAEALETARRLRDEAQAANRAKSIFLANMSHELRTPLNAILGYSQLMSRDVDVTPVQQEYLEIIARSGEHLLTLINDVLTMSKIESGRATVQTDAFDLYVLLQGLMEMFQMRADAKDLQLYLEIDAEVPQYIYADEGKLRQVLMNLLSNAVKFTAEGGVTLRVGTAVSPSHQLIFEVEDTGTGIAAEEMDMLFDPFVQTVTGQRSQEGTGLGLPICQQFVEMMGGRLIVSSMPGKGSVFRVELPVDTADAEAVTPVELIPRNHVIGFEPDQPTPDGGAWRILVVEDNITNSDLLRKLLEPVGFEVKIAENGQQGVALWESWQPHLIWMDMRMPVMDGFEATRRIKAKARESGCDVVVVALTATAFDEDRTQVIAAGCDDFVRKPFREYEIFDVLHRLLGVQFRYESDTLEEEPTIVEAANASTDMLAELLRSQPIAWRREMLHAANVLDAVGMDALIADIRSVVPDLGDVLAHWVHDFEYDRIIALLQDVVD